MSHPLSEYFEYGYLLDWYDGPTLLVARRLDGQPVAIKRMIETDELELYVVQNCSTDLYAVYVRECGVAPQQLDKCLGPKSYRGLVVPVLDNELFAFEKAAELLIFATGQRPLWVEIAPAELGGCIGLQPGAAHQVAHRVGLVELAEKLAEIDAVNEAWRLRHEHENPPERE